MLRFYAMRVRLAVEQDRREWLRLRALLWPDAALDNLSDELDEHLRNSETIAAFVLDRGDGRLGGVIEVSIRPWAEGCTTPNVGYVEGWYVDEDLRGQSWGRTLVEAAEAWARANDCIEMGSDAEIVNQDSRAAHRALGYEERIECVHFRKML